MNHQNWEWLVRASWQASVLCGLVLIVQGVLGKRLSAAWRCNLWLLVACRFLLPSSLESSFSVFNFVAREPVRSNAAHGDGGSLAVSSPEKIATKPPTGPSQSAVGGHAAASPGIAPQNLPVTPLWATAWRALLPVLWLAGAVGVILWMVANSVWFRWRLRSAREVQDFRVSYLLAQCAKEMRVRRSVRVFETRAVTSPALCGWWHPRILLPAGMIEKLDPTQLRFVFLHELAHMKRWDVAASWLMSAAEVLHWFNPLVWLASRRLRIERELACDALVLSRAGAAEKNSYGETLLRLLQEIGRPACAPGMLGMLRDDGGMRHRMKLIANFTPSTSRAILPVTLFAALVVVGLTDPLGIRGADSAGNSAPPGSLLGFRLGVDLQDGSRIVGRTKAPSFLVRDTGSGQVSALPLETISSLTWSGNTAEVALDTPDEATRQIEFLDPSVPVDSSVGSLKVSPALIKRLTVSAIRQPSVPLNGLVAFWSGDGSGVDSAGTHDGVLQNVHFTDGVVGRAFSFNPHVRVVRQAAGGFAGGDTQFPGTWTIPTAVQVADSPAFELTNSLTVVAWIRPRGAIQPGGEGRVILCRGDRRPGLDPYTVSIDDKGNVGFGIWSADGQSTGLGAPVGQDVWTHVAAVLDGDSGTMSIYTNGVLAKQMHTDLRPFGPLLPDQSPGLGIGNVNDGGSNFPFVGDLDEIGLYTRALTPAEIQGIYDRNSANVGEPVAPYESTPSPDTGTEDNHLL